MSKWIVAFYVGLILIGIGAAVGFSVVHSGPSRPPTRVTAMAYGTRMTVPRTWKGRSEYDGHIWQYETSCHRLLVFTGLTPLTPVGVMHQLGWTPTVSSANGRIVADTTHAVWVEGLSSSRMVVARWWTRPGCSKPELVADDKAMVKALASLR